MGVHFPGDISIGTSAEIPATTVRSSFSSRRPSKLSSPPPSSSYDEGGSPDADDESESRSSYGTSESTEGGSTQGENVQLPPRLRPTRSSPGPPSRHSKYTETSCTPPASSMRQQFLPASEQSTQTNQATTPTDTAIGTETIGTGRWLLRGGRGATKATAGALAAIGYSLATSALSGLEYTDTSQTTQTEGGKARPIGAFPSEDESASTGVFIEPAASTAMSGTAPTQTTGTVVSGTAATGQDSSVWRRWRKKDNTTNRTCTTAATAHRPKGLRRAAAKAIICGNDSALRSLISRIASSTDTGVSDRDNRRHGMFFDGDALARLTGVTDKTTNTGATKTLQSWWRSRRDRATTGATGASSYAPTATSIADTACTCNRTTVGSRKPFYRVRSRRRVPKSSLETVRTANPTNPANTEQSWLQSFWTGQSTQEATSPPTISVAPKRSLVSRLTGRSGATITEASVVPTATADTAVSHPSGSTALSMAGTVMSTGLGLTWGIGCAGVSALWAGGQSVYDYYTKYSPPSLKTAQTLKKGGLKSELKSTSPERSVVQSESPDPPPKPKKTVGFA